MYAATVLAAAAVTLVAGQKTFPLTFTGNAETDFPQQVAPATSFAQKRFPIIVVQDATFLDVGTPPMWPFAQSGWDMKDLRFAYDYAADTFHMAINCFGVCGDADGDGNPGGTSTVLQQRGGQDLALFASSESCAIAFDVGDPVAMSSTPDQKFDFVVGYPAQEGAGSDRFPCSVNGMTTFDTKCFGLYRFNQDPGVEQLGQRFVYKANDPLLQQAFNFAKDNNPLTSTTRPDLEWSVQNFNTLRTLAGVPKLDVTGVQKFSLNVAAFCGSFQDDGVGEDTFPNDAAFRTIDWPCFVFDACDICGGDGSTCRDCRGVPNGPAKYDICDICGGAGGRDCLGVPCGTAQTDVCNVCNGNGQSCRDCLGVPFGSAKYDACDICGGNGLTCRDCRGTPFGTAVYDVCDVCNGDGQSCLDCKAVPFGTSEYDICDVCGGDGKSCLVQPQPRNPCTPRDPHVCQLHPGDTFTATLNKRATGLPSELNGADVAFCIGELGFVTVSTAAGALFQRFSVQKDGAVIIEDHVSAPTDFACRPEQSGRYKFHWNAECSEATLERTNDNCSDRAALYDNVTIKRKECRDKGQKVYEVLPRTVWTGLDDNGDRVWINFCMNHGYLETRGPWEDANTIFGWASYAQGVVTVTELGSYPRTGSTADKRGAACTGVLADYDVRYEYLPESSDSYWSDRQGHTSVSTITDTSSQDSSYGQYRNRLSEQAVTDNDDDDDDSDDDDTAGRSSSSSSSSDSSTSPSGSSSSSSSSSDSTDELFLRKRSNVQKWHHGRGIATLETARIYGRIKDKCVERTSVWAGLKIYEVDMCNGELPQECFPEKPPCDSSSETVDGTKSPTSSSSEWCTTEYSKVGRHSSSDSRSSSSSNSDSSSSSSSNSDSSSSSNSDSSNDDDDDGHVNVFNENDDESESSGSDSSSSNDHSHHRHHSSSSDDSSSSNSDSSSSSSDSSESSSSDSSSSRHSRKHGSHDHHHDTSDDDDDNSNYGSEAEKTNAKKTWQERIGKLIAENARDAAREGEDDDTDDDDTFHKGK